MRLLFDFGIGCDCNINGSQDGSICDNVTGQCVCLPNVEGQHCSMCAPDHYGLNYANGCRPCVCDPVGSLNLQCDSITGQCSCKPGVTGRCCNQCMDSYYYFSSSGCQGTVSFKYLHTITYVLKLKSFLLLACNCTENNSEDDTCDNDGVCLCKKGCSGDKCEFPIENYFQDKNGCTGNYMYCGKMHTFKTKIRTHIKNIIMLGKQKEAWQ